MEQKQQENEKKQIQSVMQQHKEIMEEAKRDFKAELEKLNDNETNDRFKLCLAHIEVLQLGNEKLMTTISCILNGKS